MTKKTKGKGKVGRKAHENKKGRQKPADEEATGKPMSLSPPRPTVHRTQTGEKWRQHDLDDRESYLKHAPCKLKKEAREKCGVFLKI